MELCVDSWISFLFIFIASWCVFRSFYFWQLIIIISSLDGNNQKDTCKDKKKLPLEHLANATLFLFSLSVPIFETSIFGSNGCWNKCTQPIHMKSIFGAVHRKKQEGVQWIERRGECWWNKRLIKPQLGRE